MSAPTALRINTQVCFETVKIYQVINFNDRLSHGEKSFEVCSANATQGSEFDSGRF